ncbi:MarR family winged helix-turn-helix transcriptional regulator [Caminibacter pacificus]|jgi:DNA-binding MarR family transcriptional regulator|uniref:MarR family transcriptional regulator n=1 Tax=Caminibacter pacificus TaxID=1424653 RepID=A0AAJ4RBH2_9BACT|nr:MarR family transcriptional regulator [Caminibacter pacificus]NPA87179.1 MarR family transcriptional regulator [Campylobacterota bacterium]QCI29185.1 MarR family transcriptional regulator [Caminibacter pacificus]ROR38829.1 DNA-binding MarR family transcriptional regulator [Caminibacter pacificus]
MKISIDNSIGYALSTTLNLLRKEFNARIMHFNLSSEQYGVLKLIDEMGALTPTKISEILQRDKATITRIINSLEKKGFITKDRIDNRSFEIRMTKLGYEQFKNADEVAIDFHKKIRDIITDEEYHKLLEILNKIRKGF